MSRKTEAGEPTQCGRVTLRGLGLTAAVVLLASMTTAPSHAMSGAGPSPRTAVTIGDASVVVVAANDKLYAFVDGLKDNAPVVDAALWIALADGSTLRLTLVSGGQFVTPYQRTDRARDLLMLSLVSSAGTGQAAAQLTYNDASATAPAIPPAGFAPHLATGIAAMLSGAIGGALGIRSTLLAISRRRRTTAASGGFGLALRGVSASGD